MTDLALAVLAALLAVGAGAAGWHLPAYAARRTAAQPVAQDLAAEHRLVHAAVRGTLTEDELQQLAPTDFASHCLGTAWALLTRQQADGDATHPAWKDAAERLTAELATVPATDSDPRRDIRSIQDAAAHRQIVGAVKPRHVEKKDTVSVAQPDRASIAVRHPYRPASRARRVATACILAIAGGLTPLLLQLTPSAPRGSAALIAASIIMVAVAAVSAVIALVDIDTCYVDYPTLLPASGLLIAATAGLLIATGRVEMLIVAAVVTLVVTIGLELLNFLWALLRGAAGIGGGDIMLLPLALGVPTAVTGIIVMPMAVLVAAPIVMIAVLTPAFLARRAAPAARGGSPAGGYLPFAPALAFGHLAAWPVLLLLGFAGTA